MIEVRELILKSAVIFSDFAIQASLATIRRSARL
jgi:hypothetical protein